MTKEHKLRVICAGLHGRAREERMIELMKRPRQLRELVGQRIAVFRRFKAKV